MEEQTDSKEGGAFVAVHERTVLGDAGSARGPKRGKVGFPVSHQIHGVSERGAEQACIAEPLRTAVFRQALAMEQQERTPVEAPLWL